MYRRLLQRFKNGCCHVKASVRGLSGTSSACESCKAYGVGRTTSQQYVGGKLCCSVHGRRPILVDSEAQTFISGN